MISYHFVPNLSTNFSLPFYANFLVYSRNISTVCLLQNVRVEKEKRIFIDSLFVNVSIMSDKFRIVPSIDVIAEFVGFLLFFLLS